MRFRTPVTCRVVAISRHLESMAPIHVVVFVENLKRLAAYRTNVFYLQGWSSSTDLIYVFLGEIYEKGEEKSGEM
jgi:hypothetical protein